jgi:hypothetical protein
MRGGQHRVWRDQRAGTTSTRLARKHAAEMAYCIEWEAACIDFLHPVIRRSNYCTVGFIDEVVKVQQSFHIEVDQPSLFTYRWREMFIHFEICLAWIDPDRFGPGWPSLARRILFPGKPTPIVRALCRRRSATTSRSVRRIHARFPRQDRQPQPAVTVPASHRIIAPHARSRGHHPKTGPFLPRSSN